MEEPDCCVNGDMHSTGEAPFRHTTKNSDSLADAVVFTTHNRTLIKVKEGSAPKESNHARA